MDKTSDLIGGDPYPGQTPQAESDAAQQTSDMQMSPLKRDYTDAQPTRPREYNWAMNGAFVSVHALADSRELFEGMGHGDFSRPYAYGTVTLHDGWDAVWEITYANMAIHLVEQRLKRYSTNQGWSHAGIVDETGMPFSGLGVKQASDPGEGDINPGIKDWRTTDGDGGWGEDVEQVPYYGEQDYPDETDPKGPRTCTDCGKFCMDYNDWRLHTLRDHINPDREPPQYPQPVVDLDQVLPADFDTLVMDKTVQRQARLIQKFAAGSNQVITGPMPFIYDIEKDRIYVGHPGERHSDIQGRFTPGGIVEGLYMPDGKVQVKTDTDMPYTVRHMAELWYYMHPELEIKGIFLMVGEKKYKLATANIGHKVRNMAATHPAVWRAYETLRHYGNVYVVGGAVRDVILGKAPKDFDLMVQGVEPHDLESIMRQQPGEFMETGESFPVYRYKFEGDECEIALPRTERSTGVGDKDFEVVTNPYISVGEDMARRDFTVNAMAVNLDTGDLVDPYHGAEDAKSRTLRSHNPRVFEEDPMRVLRALSAVSKHGLDPSPELYQALREQGGVLAYAAPDRIGSKEGELYKIMSSADPAKAMQIALDTGVMQHIFPEVQATQGFDQKSKYHNHLLAEHIINVVRLVSELTPDPDVRIAALLHDIGKPGSQWFDEEGYGHYYKNERGEGDDHEILGAKLASARLRHLRVPDENNARITHLVRHHMFPAFSSMPGARKFLNRVGDEHADDLFNLREADMGGKGMGHDADGNVDLMRQYVQRARETQQPHSLAGLAVNGNDLIQIGIKPGPAMGRLLHWLLEQVLEDDTLNDRDTLLRMALEASEKPAEGLGGTTPTAKTSNILDEISDELDPSVFEHADAPDPDVKMDIRSWVSQTIYRIMEQNGWPDPSRYLSLYLTGSLTTYQWSKESDFDVSLWIDAKKFPEWVRADLISLMIEHAEGLVVPGTTHPLQAFVVDSVRYQPHDLYKPGLRSAYDLDKGAWLIMPEHSRIVDVHKAYPALITYCKMVEDKVRLMLKYDHYALKVMWDNIHHKRFQDQKAGKGDYAESNVVFKWLGNQGLFGPISEATGEHIA